MAHIHAGVLNKLNFQYQSVFKAYFIKFDVEREISDTTDLYINLEISQTLAESDIDNTNLQRELERQLQEQ